MIRVNDWSAIRSGATMTVTGREADLGQPVKLTGVDEVTGTTAAGKAFAIRAGKTIAELLL